MAPRSEAGRVRCCAGGGCCGAHCGPAAPSPASGAAGGRGEGVRTCSLPWGGRGLEGENGGGDVGHCTVDGCFLAGPTLLFLSLGALLLARVWKLQAQQPHPAPPPLTEPRPAASQPLSPHWGCGDPLLQPCSDRREFVRAPRGWRREWGFGGGGLQPGPCPLCLRAAGEWVGSGEAQ